MNEEEKKAEELRLAQEVVNAAEDPIALRDKEIADLKEERDNYKTVALKRLGKLPGDGEFIDKDKSETGLTTEEIVKQILIEKEIARKEQEKESEIKRILRENSELKLALKNRPDNSGVGGGSGSGDGPDVKDNVFSRSQIDAMTARAKSLKLDPEKYIARAKENLNNRSR